ncbi:MAG TPA: DUF418 domain-containing protein [Draconibacterium sp.]|nr:DUF418 domain-containing protein [Draconibacterium sp.]
MQTNSAPKNRIEVVDTLRGFALLGIMLLHSIEHFDFFWSTDLNPAVFATADPIVDGLIRALFSGKAYSIFSLMFGFSFFIQMDRAKSRGIDFRGRFIWRLTLLFIMGCLLRLVYIGEILTMYAVMGFFLVSFFPINRKILVGIAILFILQIPSIINITNSYINPDFSLNRNFGNGTWNEGFNIFANGTFFEAAKFNSWKGHIAVWSWSYYNGRYLQLLGLFILGLALGKSRFFENIMSYKKLMVRVLIISFLALLALSVLLQNLSTFEMPRLRFSLWRQLLKSYTDIVQTTVYVSLIIVIAQRIKKNKVFSVLSNYGRMSLTNYIMQPLIGVPLFYGYGFAIYRYCGPTMSLFYGIVFLTLQLWVSKIWLKHFYYGPFEWIWRALTYFDFTLKFRKKPVLSVSNN